MKKSNAMKDVITGICIAHGFDWNAANGSGLKVEVAGFMPLNITAYGKARVAVNHSYIQEGDVMFDPEIMFFVDFEGNWYPLTYEQHNLGIYQVAVEIEDGKLTRINTRQQSDLAFFADEWARNLIDQGFVDPASVSIQVYQ